MGRLRLFVMACASMAVLAAGPAAWAQNPTSQATVPTPQQLNPAELVAREAQARNNDVFMAPEAGPCPLRDSPLTFTLKGVTFEGATGTRPELLERTYKRLVGQTLPVSQICEIRDHATSALFSAGILARVEIPEQKVADGQLRLQVIEARITSIRFHGDAGPAQAKVEAYLEKLRGMTPFDLKTAQRYLLLAADVPGVQLSAAIRPAPEGRGAVELDITVSRKPVDMAANLENYGSHSVGPMAGLVRVDIKGLTSFGDRTSLVAYTTMDFHEQQIAQLIEEIHPTDTGLALSASISYAWTHPGAQLESLHLSGTALDAEFTATYPLIRARRTNLNLIGGLGVIDQNTDYASGTPLIDDSLRIVYLRADGLHRDTFLHHPYELESGLELRQGLSALGASKLDANALSRANGRPDAFVARLDGHALLGLTPWLTAYLGYDIQWTDKALLTYEQMSIGNLTIGRGYDPSSVAGDRGAALAFEPRFGPFPLPWGMQATGYGFYDAAYVRYVDQPESSTIHSAGGGIRISAPHGIDFDLFYAHPFDKPTASSLAAPAPRLLFSITVRR